MSAEDDTTTTQRPAERKPRRKRPGLWIAGLVVVLLVGAIIVRANQASAPAPEDPTVDELRAEQGVPVVVETAEVGAMASWETFNGTVSGSREAVVRARTDDPVARVHVEVGDQVHRGQILVELSGAAIEARRRQAAAAYRQARRRMRRLEPLHEAGAISDQEWEDAVTAFEVARDDLAAARESLALESPLDGTVTEVVARPGMVPSTDDELVRVADLSERVVTLRVSAPAARAIAEGQPARLRSAGGEEQPARLRGTVAEGRVNRVALQADRDTRLVDVEVAFPPDAPLFPGTLETVEVRTALRPSTLRVPRRAVHNGAVWIVDGDGRARLRRVQTGLQNRNLVEITSGLSAGDRVVVQGASELVEGARVHVVESIREV